MRVVSNPDVRRCCGGSCRKLEGRTNAGATREPQDELLDLEVPSVSRLFQWVPTHVGDE